LDPVTPPPIPPTPPPAKPDGDDAKQAGWFGRNAITMSMVILCTVAGVYFLRRVEDPLSTLYAVGTMALGLGLVIFIHELGHFLAAKLCDVHVETFSIGFGPPILGIAAFRRGETYYKIAWFPLGGYVKMLGEGSDDEGAEEDPRSFKNKSVGQRMIIISAGVVMNLILAVVCFIGVYMTTGVTQHPGVVGIAEPGGPAWEKGLRPGTMILQVGARAKPFYEELQREVLNSSPDQPLTLKYETFEGGAKTVHETKIVPKRTEEIPIPLIGIRSSSVPELAPKVRRLKSPVRPDTPAAAASPAFEFGDKIVAATDPDNPSAVTPLAPDPRGSGKADFFDLRRRMQRLVGRPMTFEVQPAAGGPAHTIEVAPAYAQTIGVRMKMGPIVGLRENSPAAKAGLRARQDKAKGEAVEAEQTLSDVIAAVEVTDGAGKPIKYSASPAAGELPLDPVKLPAQMAKWAADRPKSWDVKLTVLREKDHTPVPTILTLTWDESWDLIDDAPGQPTSPLSLSGLGIAYRVQNVVEGVDPAPSPAAGQLKAGDVVKTVRVKIQSSPTHTVEDEHDLKDDQWAYFGTFIQDDERVREVMLTVNAGQKVTLTPAVDKDLPMVDRGIVFAPDVRVQKADGIGQAFTLGTRRLVDKTLMIYENLISMVRGRLSSKTVSGPISIAAASFDIASRDMVEFILFIALININLAVVNFLPIPILDGGHMVMLIYEWLRGKPPSDTVRFVSTLCGLAIILSLFALGLKNDIQRIFF
jgi:regulator of sigma E protease